MCINISSIKRIFSNQSLYFPDMPCVSLLPLYLSLYFRDLLWMLMEGRSLVQSRVGTDVWARPTPTVLILSVTRLKMELQHDFQLMHNIYLLGRGWKAIKVTSTPTESQTFCLERTLLDTQTLRQVHSRHFFKEFNLATKFNAVCTVHRVSLCR